MNPTSFVEIKTYLINKFSEHSIDDFYIKRHPYFIFDKISQPRINSDKFIADIKERFQFSWIFVDRKFLVSLFPDLKDRQPDESSNEKDDLLSLRNQYYTTEAFSENIRKILNKNNSRDVQSKIYQYSSESNRDIKTALINNHAGIYVYNKEVARLTALYNHNVADIESRIKAKLEENEILTIEENLINQKLREAKLDVYDYFNFRKENPEELSGIELENYHLKKQKYEVFMKIMNNKSERSSLKRNLTKEIQIRDNYKYSTKSFDLEQENKAFQFITTILFQEIITNANPKSSHYKPQIEEILPFDERNYELFWKTYNKYDYVSHTDWKEDLINIFNCDITRPYIFHIFFEKEEKKPKLAQILYEVQISDTEKIQANIDDVFPILFSIKTALENNPIIKSTDKVFYLSLNNVIYVKLQLRKNKTPNDEFVIAFNYKGGITKYTEILSGYTPSGYMLNNGLYINYLDWAIEIEFDANALLMKDFKRSQPIQNTPFNPNIAENI
ncbi:MAG: hypothetical protein WCH34_17450 [Bacteroidota bacterium]